MTHAGETSPSNFRTHLAVEWRALAFLMGCAALAVPLLFPGRIPGAVLVAALAGLATLFAWRALSSGTLVPRTPVDWPNLLFLLLLPLGVWASADPMTSWPAVYKIIAGWAILYGLAGLAGSAWMRYLPGVFLTGSLVLALLMVAGTRWFPGKGLLPSILYDFLPTRFLPWQSEGTHPNLTGGAMVILLPPAVALAAWSRTRWLRILAIIAVILVALVLMLTQSRGAWVAAVVALLLMPLLRYRRWWMVVVIAGIVGGVILLLTRPGWLVSNLFEPVQTTGTSLDTLPSRIELWIRSLAIVRDFGLSGVGPGMFERVVMVLYPPFFNEFTGEFIHAHNIFLLTAAELGIPGLIAQLAMFLALAAGLVVASKSWQSREQKDSATADLTALAIGLFGSLIAYASHGLTDAPLVAQRGYALSFAVFGAAAAVSTHLLTRPCLDESSGASTSSSGDSDSREDPEQTS
ncbi:MAG: O-antigen ligase family protein [Chloroflexota bacterium]|nr:O-antigen ligase family protein [Chloroflexota bacterium]